MLMKELAKLGCNPVVITSDSNNLFPVPRLESNKLVQDVDGVRLVWLKTLKYTVAKSIRRIFSWFHFEWNILRLAKSDLPAPEVIIVSSLSILTILNGFLLKRKYKCPLVFEVRDIWPLTLVEEGGFSAKNPLVLFLGFIERLGYKYSDTLVGTMPNLGQHVEEVLGFSRQVHCVPMGVDPVSALQAESIPDTYRNTYLASDKFSVVHAGTIGITNALDTFFEAAQVMADEGDIQFICVGDGSLKDAYIKKFGHLKNLTFAPKVPKSMVHSVLESCDLLYFSVLPSKVWNFGLSLNKVIDYMLSGKPVVASYSGFPSMINEAGCGSFVPAADVDALVNEIKRYKTMGGKERQAMGEKGREWLLLNRGYDVLARQYLEILKS